MNRYKIIYYEKGEFDLKGIVREKNIGFLEVYENTLKIISKRKHIHIKMNLIKKCDIERKNLGKYIFIDTEKTSLYIIVPKFILWNFIIIINTSLTKKIYKDITMKLDNIKIAKNQQ